MNNSSTLTASLLCATKSAWTIYNNTLWERGEEMRGGVDGGRGGGVEGRGAEDWLRDEYERRREG